MTKIDGLEIVMTKQMQKMIDKELKKRFEELKLELATRYEELLNMRNMEADQFNDGFNDARAGKLETDHPHYDLDTDNWRLGYAYGMFEPMKEKLAREHQLSDALYLLLVDDPNTKLKAEQILIDIYGKYELETRINELEQARHWIPVSERLPEPYVKVLACTESGYMEVDYRYAEPIIEVGVAEFHSLENVTHWMPLPQPPEDK